jgi:hypothetical protein
MKLRKLRRRFAFASSLAAAGTAAALLLGVGLAGTASASVTIPAFPTFGSYPYWFQSNDSVGNVDHAEGSDTTLFVMQSISDLYSQSGILPFSCQLTSGLQTCNTSGNPNVSQSDPLDNFTGNEELQGIWDVGSGNGQEALCGTITAPGGLPTDYARSSKPAGGSGTCATEQEVGFAKDAIVAVDFQKIDPNLYGSPTGYLAQTDPKCSSSGAGFYPSYNSAGTLVCTAFPSGGIGPVAAGWLPGDPFNCVPAGSGLTGTACSGTPFTDVDDGGTTAVPQGAAGNGSVAARLWCINGAVTSGADLSQITDWGQLTNLSASAPGNGGVAQPVGDGAPIGVPIRVIAVNNGSGTTYGWMQYAESGSTGGSSVNCTTKADYDANGASGPDPDASQGYTGNLEIALENDANQIGDFANANWPSDAADQAVDIATSLYFMGFGVYGTNANATEASIETSVPSGDPSTFTSSYLTSNLIAPNTANDRNNHYPASRTLFNIFLTNNVKASVGNFLNWICDGGSASGSGTGAVGPMNAKGTDHIDGGNFDTDLTNVITGEYGYSRLTDTTAELQYASQTDTNQVTNPNGTCAGNLPISSITVGSPTITVPSLPASVQPGWTVEIPNGYNEALNTAGTGSTGNGFAGDSIDTILSVNTSTNTITLNHNVIAGTGTAGTAPPTIYFPGHPPVLNVTNLNQ